MDVRCENVSKRFGETVALAPTDLTIRDGEFLSLLGPSGCGKTTLLRSIAGLEQPDSGRVVLGDEVVFSAEEHLDTPPERRGVGMVFQDFALWPHLTVMENVAFGLRARNQAGALGRGIGRLFGRTRDDERLIVDRVEWALSKVRLTGFERRYPDQLSGGQKQRVSFARAIVTSPNLLLLDEPLSALDAILREQMRVELAALVRELGMTALYVTHDQSEAMSMSDRIAVMNEGRILQTGTPEDLYLRPADKFVARFVGRSNALSINGSYQMVRPERIRRTRQSEEDLVFSGTVRQVSFRGDRYEVLIALEDGREWIGYVQDKPTVGDSFTAFVSPNDVHAL